MAMATRQRLLDAAVELMIEGSSAAITTGRLTGQAGVVQSAFYNHFSSVAECKQAALDEIRSRVEDATEMIFDEVRSPSTSAEEDIGRILQQVFHHALSRPAQYRLLTHRSHTPDVTVVIEDVLAELEATASQAILQESSRLSFMPPAAAGLAASLLVSTFLGGLKLVLDGGDPERIAATTAQFMAAGLFAVAAVSDPR